MNILQKSNRFPSTPMAEMKDGTAILSSWKDIACYLGKGVRTAQRWEKELGLPVRRPKEGIKSAVLAFPSELNDWVLKQRLSGEPDLSETDEKVDLLGMIQELKAENSALRYQLQLLRAKSA